LGHIKIAWVVPGESLLRVTIPGVHVQRAHLRGHHRVMFHEVIRGAPQDILFTAFALLPHPARVPYPPSSKFSTIEDVYATIG
jgi:hypothetical protein